MRRRDHKSFDGHEIIDPTGDAAHHASALRAAGLVAATLPESDEEGALAFARAWGYDAVVSVSKKTLGARRVSDGASARWNVDTPTSGSRKEKAPASSYSPTALIP